MISASKCTLALASVALLFFVQCAIGAPVKKSDFPQVIPVEGAREFQSLSKGEVEMLLRAARSAPNSNVDIKTASRSVDKKIEQGANDALNKAQNFTKLSRGAIIGIAVGAVALVILLLLCCLCCCCCRK